ncbi:MAG: rhodanese-related sulfurtransferase [Burkholderiaceae bacterium]|nr:rhodanese-related sulfurtransferase [Burkholderiaceae bacterium]
MSLELAPRSPEYVRQAWREAGLGREIALLDLREEDPYAQSHPLFAANLPLGLIELQAWSRLPRRDVEIVLYGEGAFDAALIPAAAARLRALGYVDIAALEGGLPAWSAGGGELFRDVNVPSKAFGELVEAEVHTPSLPAQQVQALLDANADLVVLDARRFDEYQTMSIPTGISVPGAELVLRARDLAPDPRTQIIVNCAGRTRSLIGAQSLINAGLPNPVAALRNGTIGWTLAGQTLEHGQNRRAGPTSDSGRAQARRAAQDLARRAGARFLPLAQRDELKTAQRSLFWLDVRTPEEYRAGHLAGFSSAPGGQLVQETDHHVAVRGARLVLLDDDGARAAMTASWLTQLGWEVWVLEGAGPADWNKAGPEQAPLPELPEVARVQPELLADWLAQDGAKTLVLDLAPSAEHVRQHIPGSWWALSSALESALTQVPDHARIVLSCRDGLRSRFAAAHLAARIQTPVFWLQGGLQAWTAQRRPVEAGDAQLASPRSDRYRRPYEGTSNPREAMQAYLDWEFGLVAQLTRDGTHGFSVLPPLG